MRRFLLLLGALTSLAAPLAAQALEADTPRAGELRRLIEERFTAKVKEELGLSDEQSTRMRATLASFFVKRRDLEAEDQRLRVALGGQLRPGVAADQDSVARLTQSMLDLKVRYAQSYKDEMKELSGYLTPVQRAQYLLLREKLLERVRQAREDLEAGGVGGRRRLRP